MLNVFMLSLCTSMPNFKKLGINTTSFQLQNYLPSTGDWKLLRSRMKHVVKKILCKYVPQFSDMEVRT